ncbi:HNH endonuclease [Candidatus Pacearchaeota archaeon]|nr:HNH endonuclease [Candidatus Pacearchaeota archaeon]
MSRPIINLVGKRFGRLLVIKMAGSNKHGQILWKCLCDCGGTIKSIGTNLKKGCTRSCGCIIKGTIDEITKRFWTKVDKRSEDECWKWLGNKTTSFHGKPITAHRLAWLLLVGPIPNRLCVCHRCESVSCVNPKHLILGKTRQGRSQATLFWKNTKKLENGCIEWQKTVSTAGYGRLRLDGNTILAHRLSWIITNGPIPDGMFVLHKCDNPLCVNPDHLFLGTQNDNMQDMIKKGRYVKPNVKLTKEMVDGIRKKYSIGNTTHRKLSDEYGVCKTQIGNIVRGNHWTT